MNIHETIASINQKLSYFESLTPIPPSEGRRMELYVLAKSSVSLINVAENASNKIEDLSNIVAIAASTGRLVKI